MARLKNGFLGNASGKLGNVVFAKWRDLFTARSYQPDIQDAKTRSQRSQRARMVALLNFLSPINEQFIRLFNENVCPGSTPWAKAIKDNMPAVGQECCFSLDKLKLGVPKFPPAAVRSAIYDPFIDQVKMNFSVNANPATAQEFPCIVSSVLGKYRSGNELHEFDTRHTIRSFPDGRFYSDIRNLQLDDNLFSWWMHAWIWISSLNLDNPDPTYKINDYLSEPFPVVPQPLIEEFNTEMQEDIIPVSALEYDYEDRGDSWNIIFEIDRDTYDPERFVNYTMTFWILALTNDNHFMSDPVPWNLSENRYVYNVNKMGNGGGAVMLYYLHDRENNQISKFNRLFINMPFGETQFSYFGQLFKCNHTHPASFVLADDECGFCGSFNELFAEFIRYWKQPDHPGPNEEFPLDSPTYEIDDQYFKCEITSVDGTPIKEAQKNNVRMFYSDGLIPGQEYTLIFSYDNILLSLLQFNCPDPAKVVYLSPQHIISNKNLMLPSESFIALIRKIKKRQDYFQVPPMNWSNRTLEVFLTTNPPNKADYLCPKKPKKHGSGADLAGKIK